MRNLKIIAAIAIALPAVAGAQVGPNPAVSGGSLDPTMGPSGDSVTAPQDQAGGMNASTRTGEAIGHTSAGTAATTSDMAISTTTKSSITSTTKSGTNGMKKRRMPR